MTWGPHAAAHYLRATTQVHVSTWFPKQKPDLLFHQLNCLLPPPGSGWELFKPLTPLANVMYAVPAGAMMRMYANISLTRFGVPHVDLMYVWPSNTDAALTRAMLKRNFANISPGKRFMLEIPAYYTS